jgi:hypothetical protein
VALQENVPQAALSRVYSYDALGSFVLVPVGLMAAGPIADAIGRDATLFGSVALLLVVVAGMLSIRDVRRLQRHDAT